MTPGPRHPPALKRPATVIALGASAGGLESLGRLLGGLPEAFPAPILVALHLDPHHISQAVPLLQMRTKLKVKAALAGTSLQAGTVYVAPPDHHLELRGGKIRLTHAARVSYSRPSIDVLFASVAKDYGPACIVVVLSGTGSDGSAGLIAAKRRGGLAVAEDPSTAAFAGMPNAAERTGLLDAILPVRQIPAFLARAVAHRVTVTEQQWGRMLVLLASRTGARFSRYRSSTLHRRLQQRLGARGCRTMAAYLRILERDGAEVDRLHAAFLIKVSSFHRDPASWRALAREAAPLAAQRPEGLRAWSAGCATGEEAYTLAMLLARTLGLGPAVPWKVFATDLDEGALKAARAARYSDDQVRGVPRADLAKYFVRDRAGWRVGKALRGRVVFGRHDLLHDPPLANMDVLACRNVLIYFSPEEREKTLRRLCFAVNPGGVLFLGRAEALRPIEGFDRVGLTTFFRRRVLPGDMPRRKKSPHGPSGADPKGDGPKTPERPRRSPRPRGRASDETGFLAQQDLNEELQSRNEELETVNEELQSLNDELSTMEEQMRGLGEESRRANDFLRILLNTSPDVLVACDADNRVTFWNKAAIKRFRLSPEQAVGGELFDLVPALSTTAIRAAARKVRGPGKGGRVSLQQHGAEYSFDPLPSGAGKRRGYLMRVRVSA
ncbi:MAG: chemotaxis protein CheB [Thermoplasmatota archaeon]